VAGTELSTQFSKNTRRQIDLLFSHVLPDRWDIFGTIYGGISFIQFSENQKSTYVVVDTVGEYGTDYAQDRTSSFFSPRVGLKLNNISGSKQRLLSSLNYELTFSPVYYIIMNQKLTYNTVDGNEDEYTNELYRWSSPYIDHRLEIRVNKYLRTSIYHSFMYLSYSTLQLADNGWDVYAVDDPTYINVLRVNFDFTMPLGEIVTFNIGAGYQWTYTRRTSNRIPESLNKTTTKNPYIRIGSTLLDY